MSQPVDAPHPSDSEIDYEHEINVHEEDEEDWQDAEEQQPSDTAAALREPTPQNKNKINEVDLRKKIREIQQNADFTPTEKARQIQVSKEFGHASVRMSRSNISVVPNVSWYNSTSCQ